MLRLAICWNVVLLFSTSHLSAQSTALDSLRNQAMTAIETRSDSAFVIAQRLFITDSSSPISVALFANANYQIGKSALGDFYVENLLKNDSLYFQAMSLKASSSLAHHELDVAVEVLQKLNTHYPNEAETHYLQAQFFLQNEQIAQAIESNNRALTIAPNMSEAMLLSAQLNFKTAKFKQAAEGFQQQLSFIKNDPNSLNSYGVALLKIDRATEAIEILSRALSLDTQSTVILYNLGLAYLQTANFSQARSCFQQQKSRVDTMPELDLLIAKCWVQEQSLEKALASYQRYSEQAAEPTVQKEILLIKAAIFLSKNWYWLLGAFTLAVSLFVFLRSRKT